MIPPYTWLNSNTNMIGCNTAKISMSGERLILLRFRQVTVHPSATHVAKGPVTSGWKGS